MTILLYKLKILGDQTRNNLKFAIFLIFNHQY